MADRPTRNDRGSDCLGPPLFEESQCCSGKSDEGMRQLDESRKIYAAGDFLTGEELRNHHHTNKAQRNRATNCVEIRGDSRPQGALGRAVSGELLEVVTTAACPITHGHPNTP